MTRIVYTDPLATNLCAESIYQALQTYQTTQKVICVCIGTDRSTGDSLGPIVGSLLSKHTLSNVTIQGTLEKPVHAINLHNVVEQLEYENHRTRIIAIDACLGQSKNVGKIQVGIGPIKPGAGVNKDLPAIGHIHITGIVNVSGYMEYFVLQNTRLSLVMHMAEIISQSLLKTFRENLAIDKSIRT